jgi:hypothetical protein
MEVASKAEGSVPVHTPTVVFVLSVSQGRETSYPSATEAALGQIEHRLHARPLAVRAGIEAFVWHPPPGAGRITLPGL